MCSFLLITVLFLRIKMSLGGTVLFDMLSLAGSFFLLSDVEPKSKTGCSIWLCSKHCLQNILACGWQKTFSKFLKNIA